MKNIHVLPTSQPSRLYKHEELGFKLLAPVEHEIGQYNGSNQHIYITSDEEIKEGDYFTDDNNSLKRSYKLSHVQFASPKKIILTTDGDLIKDGVQPIDDEFLEWFVKNPSCEYVTIRKKSVVKAIAKRIGIKNFDNGYKIIIPKSELANKLKQILDNMPQEEFNEEWKKITDLKMEGPSIIIPKEEQKQHLIDMMRNDEELGLYDEAKTKCYCGHTTYCDCGPEQELDILEVPMPIYKETLEEAAERLYPKTITDPYNPSEDLLREERSIFIAGAQWQQERICDSEVIQRIRASKSDAEARRIIRTI